MPKDLRSLTTQRGNRRSKCSGAEDRSHTKHHSTGGTGILKLLSLLFLAIALFVVATVANDRLNELKAQADLSTQRLDNLCTHFKTGCTQKYVK